MSFEQINKYLSRIRSDDPRRKEFLEEVLPALKNKIVLPSVDTISRYLCPYCNSTSLVQKLKRQDKKLAQEEEDEEEEVHVEQDEQDEQIPSTQVTLLKNDKRTPLLKTIVEEDDKENIPKQKTKIISFTTYFSLIRHLTEKHSQNLPCNGQVFERSIIIHTCKVCSKSFNRKEHYLGHLKSKSHRNKCIELEEDEQLNDCYNTFESNEIFSSICNKTEAINTQKQTLLLSSKQQHLDNQTSKISPILTLTASETAETPQLHRLTHIFSSPSSQISTLTPKLTQTSQPTKTIKEDVKKQRYIYLDQKHFNLTVIGDDASFHDKTRNIKSSINVKTKERTSEKIKLDFDTDSEEEIKNGVTNKKQNPNNININQQPFKKNLLINNNDYNSQLPKNNSNNTTAKHTNQTESDEEFLNEIKENANKIVNFEYEEDVEISSCDETVWADAKTENNANVTKPTIENPYSNDFIEQLSDEEDNSTSSTELAQKHPLDIEYKMNMRNLEDDIFSQQQTTHDNRLKRKKQSDEDEDENSVCQKTQENVKKFKFK